MAEITNVLRFVGSKSAISINLSIVEKFGKEAISNLVDVPTNTQFIVKSECFRSDSGYRFKIMDARELIILLGRDENPAHGILSFQEKPSESDVVKMVELLHSLGYTKTGQEWEPPLGENPLELEKRVYSIIEHTLLMDSVQSTNQIEKASKEVLKLFKK